MPPPLPPGSHAIARWAAQNGLAYTPYPEEMWFRRWEPHDTITPPSSFLNACTWTAPPQSSLYAGHIVLVEPWYAADDGEPLQRTLLAFIGHTGFRWRAAIQVGEHFLTRVAYLESPKPPTVRLGDPLWDAHVETSALCAGDAVAAFHPSLRKLLSGWAFRGHLEMRKGGLVLYYADFLPTPNDYDRLLRTTREIAKKALFSTTPR